VSKALRQIDFKATKVQPLDEDARGSVPFVATNGRKEVFIKVVNRRNVMADWAFKMWRRAVYHNLEDEVPYLSPKQALTHEAYVSSLASDAGVRTPTILGVLDLKDFRFGLVEQKLDAEPLDRIKRKRLTDRVLRKVWREVAALHEARIAHRDLRAANILIDSKNNPWIIDFDFGTITATPKNMIRDNVELLVSLSTLVGVKRAVATSRVALKQRDYKLLLPFLHYRWLTSATRNELKHRINLLERLRTEVATKCK
jgi:undecaprenyl-diphosphatase